MLKKIFSSAELLKNTRVLCACAILTAMYVVLDMLQIPITPQSRISFVFLSSAIAGWLFGAIPAAIVGALGDTIGFLIHPTGAYFPGFMITAVLSGLLYGVFLFKAEEKGLLWRVTISCSLAAVFLNTLLNTYWLSILYQKGYILYLADRGVKNLFTLPINIVVLYILLILLMRNGIKRIYK